MTRSEDTEDLVRALEAARAENELLRSRYAELERSSGAMVSEIAPDGTIAYSSANHLEILGFPAEQLVGMNYRALQALLQLEAASDDPMSDEDVARLAAPGGRLPLHSLRCKDGTTIWVESDLTTFEAPDGARFLSISHPLTQRTEAESVRLESEARLRSAQEVASVGSFTLSPASGQLEFSAECRRVLGVEDSHPEPVDLLRWVHPADRARCRDGFEQALRTGHFDFEFRYSRPGAGQQFLRVCGDRVATGGEQPLVLGTLHDITGLRNAEAEARESKHRLHQILMSLPTTQIIVWDRDCTATAVYSGPQAKAYGLTASRAKGAKAGDLLAEPDRQRGFENVRSVFETGQTLLVRESVPLPAGTFVFDISISPLRDDSGEIQTVLTVCHDVTERVRAEEEQALFRKRVEETQKLESLGLLAGGVAHDFNNLLVGILGNAELALGQAEPGSSLHRLLESIERSSQHASDLTEQLLTFAGRGQSERERLELGSTIDEMRELIHTNLRGAAELRIETPAEPLWVEVDPVQLRQLVMNLASNAFEATEGRGVVTVRTGVCEASREVLAASLAEATVLPGTFAFVEVEDQGPGVTTADRAQIFDPFYTTKRDGRGLGLSAVIGIAKAHGGAIQVQSTPGDGATFRALFPCASRLGAAGSVPPTEGEWQGEGVVLVVDDSEMVRNVTVGALEQIGFTPLAAVSGFEAIEILRDAKDVVAVLLDVTMPGMDGVETFRHLRALRGDMPVLFMSGNSRGLLDQQLAGERDVASLRKPFTIAGLASAMQSLIAGDPRR